MKKLAKYETIYLDLKKKILEGVFQDGGGGVHGHGGDVGE